MAKKFTIKIGSRTVTTYEGNFSVGVPGKDVETTKELLENAVVKDNLRPSFTVVSPDYLDETNKGNWMLDDNGVPIEPAKNSVDLFFKMMEEEPQIVLISGTDGKLRPATHDDFKPETL